MAFHRTYRSCSSAVHHPTVSGAHTALSCQYAVTHVLEIRLVSHVQRFGINLTIPIVEKLAYLHLEKA